MLLLLLGVMCTACGKKEESVPETTEAPAAWTTTKSDNEVMSVDTDRSLEIDGVKILGKSGSYVGFSDAQSKDWKAPETALREGWVLQGGDRIAHGPEKLTAFVRNCEEGIPGRIRIQRHFFGSESTEETVFLTDVFFDGEQYYTASLDDGGVIWTKQAYARFVIREKTDAKNGLLITHYVLTDGSDPVYDEQGIPVEDENTFWVTSEYTYPLETLVTMFVGDHDYLNFDGKYTGFSEDAPTNVFAFYASAHEKKPCRVRVVQDGIKTDLIFDGRRYYVAREDSSVVRVFGHSCLFETQYGTYLTLSATNGLTFETYREDVTSYTVYIAP